MIRNSIYKILSLLLIIGLNWTAISAIGNTFAYFSDTETASSNTCSAGTLDFSLSSPTDFFPPTPDASNQLIRDISVVNQGSLGFKYQIRTDGLSGNFCNNLQLTGNLDNGGVECPTTSLASFNCGPFEISDSTDHWQFTASLPEGFSPGFIPKSCEFKLVFEAWQTNLAPSSGFSDVEEIENKVTKCISDLLPRLDIVINEFLPNPVGPDDALAPNGEWVELYNKGSATIALTNWYFMDLDGKLLPIPASSIAPKGFLAVYLNGAFSPGWLDNTGDGLALLAPQDVLPSPFCFGGYCLVDVHFYLGDKVIEGKSFARIPDGSNVWYDPMPTPGQQNQLSEEEIEAGLQPDIIELNQEQLFQRFIDQLSEEPISDETPNEEVAPTETTASEEMTVKEETAVKEEPITEEALMTEEELVIEEEFVAEEGLDNEEYPAEEEDVEGTIDDNEGNKEPAEEGVEEDTEGGDIQEASLDQEPSPAVLPSDDTITQSGDNGNGADDGSTPDLGGSSGDNGDVGDSASE